MKKYKATVCFAGIVSMYAGEVRELPQTVAADLLACGYIEEVKEEKAADKPKPKGGRKNDSKSTKR